MVRAWTLLAALTTRLASVCLAADVRTSALTLAFHNAHTPLFCPNYCRHFTLCATCCAPLCASPAPLRSADNGAGRRTRLTGTTVHCYSCRGCCTALCAWFVPFRFYSTDHQFAWSFLSGSGASSTWVGRRTTPAPPTNGFWRTHHVVKGTERGGTWASRRSGHKGGHSLHCLMQTLSCLYRGNVDGGMRYSLFLLSTSSFWPPEFFNRT